MVGADQSEEHQPIRRHIVRVEKSLDRLATGEILPEPRHHLRRDEPLDFRAIAVLVDTYRFVRFVGLDPSVPSEELGVVLSESGFPSGPNPL